MHANLDEEMSRVVVEKLLDNTRNLNQHDRDTYHEACFRLNESMLSRADSHKSYLVSQGMTPERAAQHVRHRYGF